MLRINGTHLGTRQNFALKKKKNDKRLTINLIRINLNLFAEKPVYSTPMSNINSHKFTMRSPYLHKKLNQTLLKAYYLSFKQLP